MRTATTLLGTVLALALAWPARGATPVGQATVQTEGAEVRCKPGTEPAIYVTQTLPRGAVVQVVEPVANGWLKIEPPRGSFSWVNTRALRPADGVPGVWIVGTEGAPVPVLVGSPFKPGKPDVVGTLLARGAQVIAVGGQRPSEDQDGWWLPILPPPGDFRYIREADVSVPAGGSRTAAAPVGSALPALSPTATPTPTAPDAAKPLRPQPAEEVHVPAPAPDVDPLLRQAEQLERAGDRAGAARLYDQLGNKYAASNHQAAAQYYNQAAWLRGNTTPAAPASPAEVLYQQARQYEQAGDRAQASQAYARLGDMFRDSDYSLSMQYYNAAARLRQGQATPAARGGATPPAAGTPPATPGQGPPSNSQAAPPPATVVQARALSVQIVGPGTLNRSAYPIDGRPTYVLETPQAQVLAYLTPQAGVDLERYVGQNVEALGQLVPRTDLRDKYMSVARVRAFSPPPP